MKSTLIRGFVATALLTLGATSLPALAQQPAPAKPPTLTRSIERALGNAQKAIGKEAWTECLAEVAKAQAVANPSPYDLYAINELLGFCAARSNDYATTATAWEASLNSGFLNPTDVTPRHRQLLQLHYSLKNYAKAADYGKKTLALGEKDEGTYLRTAQSFYLLNDYASTKDLMIGWIRDMEAAGATPPLDSVQLYLSSCMRLEDDECTFNALETQAIHHPKPETWPNIVLLVFRKADPNSALDVWRLAFERGALRRGEEYAEMAQLSIERGLPGEAKTVLESGAANGMFGEQRIKELADRLLASATTQIRTDRADLDKQAAQTAAGTNGQVDVRVGQAFMSYGDPAKAVELIERGLAKGNVRNVPDAQLSLGIAQLRTGNKAAAMAAFNAVSGNPTLETVARLWKIAAR